MRPVSIFLFFPHSPRESDIQTGTADEINRLSGGRGENLKDTGQIQKQNYTN